MLVFVLATFPCAVYVIARGARAAARRLDLDPMAVALWLGLAERPLIPLPRRR